MNVLVAPLELKGTLTAAEATDAMARGLGSLALTLLPLADGGPGTAACVPGRFVPANVTASHGARIATEWRSAEGLAIVESAKATGLTLLPAAERRPLSMTSRGVGELIGQARDAGEKRIAVAVGGTGTVDLGLGCAHALGVRFRDAEGRDVEPLPEHFHRIASIDRTGIALDGVRLEAWLDVRAPLVGESGAVFCYGGQKGVARDDMASLDAELGRVADLVGAPRVDGDGAGGGLGWALRVLLGADVRSGFDAVAEAVALDAAIDAHELVITAEGRFDAQSLQGKGPWALAKRSRRPVMLFCGASEVPRSQWEGVFSDVIELGPVGDAPAEVLTRAVRSRLRTGVAFAV